MKKILLLTLLLSGCTQTGPNFINCSDENKANLALDISLENMDSIDEIVYRTDFICKEELPQPRMACYIARMGDKDFGNRAMILMQDKYCGECVIHELYHVQLGVKFHDTCNNHSVDCGWEASWLENLLDEYKDLINE